MIDTVPSRANTHPLSRFEWFVAAGVAVALVLGCSAYLAALPPFEGFDEPAHYSYIAYLASRWEIPDFRTSRVDRVAEVKRMGLPAPYESAPPYRPADAPSYSDFFQSDATPERAESVRRLWTEPASLSGYVAGDRANWEAQQPPLYYLLMVPAYVVSREWPLAVHLLVLRGVSVALASLSLLFWVGSLRLLRTPRARMLALYAGLAASMFPSLYFDLGRLGNDSLSTLLFGASWYFLLSAYSHELRRDRDIWSLALTLSLGLLTKVFFLGLLAGMAASVIWFGFLRFGARGRDLVRIVAPFMIVPAVVAGWWFALSLARYGLLVPSDEMYHWLRSPSSPGPPLAMVNVLDEIARAGRVMVLTGLWSGTWSLVRPPLPFYLLFLPVTLLVLGMMCVTVRRPKWTESCDVLVLGAMSLGSVVALLGWHMVAQVRFTGVGTGTPGWYVFILWPVAGLAVAPVLASAKRRARLAGLVSLGLVMLFEVIGWWLLMLVHSGQVEKTQSLYGGTVIAWPSAASLSTALSNLDQLALPELGLLLLAASLGTRAALLSSIACRRP